MFDTITPPRDARFTFIDTESCWDEHLHEAYRRIDPKVQPHHRLGSKRIFAASAFDVTVTHDGQISCDSINSWTEHTHGGEHEIVAGLFDHLRAHDNSVVVGYGSIATDISLLQLAALEYGLLLPKQLTERRPAKGSPWWPHTDVGLELKGRSKTWHHQTEVLLRLGLPVELIATKARVDYPTTADQWLAVRASVELDAALVAIVTLAWMRIQGQQSLHPATMMIAVLDWLRRHGHPTEKVADNIVTACAMLTERVGMAWLEAA